MLICDLSGFGIFVGKANIDITLSFSRSFAGFVQAESSTSTGKARLTLHALRCSFVIFWKETFALRTKCPSNVGALYPYIVNPYIVYEP